MAGQLDKSSVLPDFEAVAKAIDSVTNLYNAVAVKSPGVADTVVILVVLMPFFAMFCGLLGLSVREKQATKRVSDARRLAKQGAKKVPGGKKA